ncbi:MAG: ThuA domain-containing protein, partial [Melioribacteraceae bacterium]|nr:ThuA domain-containing protein [Melioribacteraceae bacterium]
QYYMHIDPAIEILATTSFSDEHDTWIKGTVMPVVWKKKFGEGKVFYSSLGHSIKDFEVPEVLTIMQRGILWVLDEL